MVNDRTLWRNLIPRLAGKWLDCCCSCCCFQTIF